MNLLLKNKISQLCVVTYGSLLTLSVFLTGLTKEELGGNSVMFMVAGYETTATTLTFTAYCLATNPECQEKLIAEIDSTIGQVYFLSVVFCIFFC